MGGKDSLPKEWHIKIVAVPKNMHLRHAERREDRAKTLHKSLGFKKDVVYVDAAGYQGRNVFPLAAMNYQGTPILSGSVTTGAAEEAEAAAIAITIVSIPAIKIVRDSKYAAQKFACGRVFPTAAEMLSS